MQSFDPFDGLEDPDGPGSGVSEMAGLAGAEPDGAPGHSRTAGSGGIVRCPGEEGDEGFDMEQRSCIGNG
jgi:hypothetical protein